MERDRGGNASFSFERHFKLTKTFPSHYLPAGVASSKPILQMSRLGLKKALEVVPLRLQSKLIFLPWLPLQRRRRKTGGAGVSTSFRLEVGDAMHDHMVQKQGLVVHFDGAREQAAEVMHVPGAGTGAASAKEV